MEKGEARTKRKAELRKQCRDLGKEAVEKLLVPQVLSKEHQHSSLPGGYHLPLLFFFPIITSFLPKTRKAYSGKNEKESVC